MAVLVSIGVVAEIFGVSTQTIRNWVSQGLFTQYRTYGNHRRFSSEILLQICRLRNIEVVTLHQKQEKSFEYQLAEDVLAILTVYSSKIYGRRSHEKRLKSCS